MKTRLDIPTALILVGIGAGITYFMADAMGYLAKPSAKVEQEIQSVPRDVYVESELKIGNETLRIIGVPRPLYAYQKSLDRHCLLYTNVEARMSDIHCLED